MDDMQERPVVDESNEDRIRQGERRAACRGMLGDAAIAVGPEGAALAGLLLVGVEEKPRSRFDRLRRGLQRPAAKATRRSPARARQSRSRGTPPRCREVPVGGSSTHPPSPFVQIKGLPDPRSRRRPVPSRNSNRSRPAGRRSARARRADPAGRAACSCRTPANPTAVVRRSAATASTPGRGNCVDADSLARDLLRKSLAEVHDRRFRRGVVQQDFGRIVSVDRRGVDDRRSRSEMWQRRLGDPEHRIDVWS